MTSEAELAETIDRQRVEGLTSRFAEPSWLADDRLAAWESYFQTPMPGPRDSEFRRTDLSVLDLTKLKAFNLGRARLVDELPALPLWYQSALRHFGKYSGALFQTTENGSYLCLNKELAGQGVIFLDLAAAIEKHPELVRPYLTGAETDGSGKFEYMTRALFNCGAFLYVPAGVELQHPFVVGTGFCGCGKENGEHGGAIFPRLIVVAEENSKADIVSVMGCEGDRRCGQDSTRPISLASALSDLHIKSGARVAYLEVQEFGADVFFIHRFNSHLQSDAQFTSMTLCLGGKQTKSDIATYLQAPGARSEVLGAVLGSGHEHFNFNTIQEHNAPDTQSDINFRVALKDASTSVYQGIIRVAKSAQRTNAYQSNKNLLLGGEAKADSVPKLEILADDVKCSHGATVGPVDREQIFYLMSRGLTAGQAEELVVLGFFRKVLAQFPLQESVPWLTEVVSAKIYALSGGDHALLDDSLAASAV